MISIHCYEPSAPVAQPDEKVSRVLDCAEFFYAKHDPHTRATVTFWRLIKSVPPYPKGTVLTLKRLHAILFP